MNPWGLSFGAGFLPRWPSILATLVPFQIPAVKQVIRKVSVEECERLARKVGSLDSDRRILSTLRKELQNIVPEALGGWSTEQTTEA